MFLSHSSRCSKNLKGSRSHNEPVCQAEGHPHQPFVAKHLTKKIRIHSLKALSKLLSTPQVQSRNYKLKRQINMFDRKYKKKFTRGLKRTS